MKYSAKFKHVITSTVTIALLIISTIFSSNSHADFFDGRVDVWNSPLNVRSCASSSCQRVGRLLRDQIQGFNGTYSSNSWLKTFGVDSDPIANSYAYGQYIREGTDSLQIDYVNTYQATTTSALNLREGPMVQYDRITTIPKGALVTVNGKNGHYFKISWLPNTAKFTPYINGYVHSNWVRRN